MSWFSIRAVALRRDSERGASQTIFLIGVATSLMLVIGLVVDGGGKLNAIEHANAAAQQAARIAGQHLSAQGAQSGGGAVADHTAAISAAEQALSVQGVDGTVAISGDQVTVTTTASYDTVFLPIIGITSLTGTGQATARIAEGISTEFGGSVP